MRFVLDTNTLIYFFKGMGRVAQQLMSVPPRDIGLPAIVVFELQVGIAKSVSPERRTMQLTQLIDVVQVLPFGLNEARHVADIRASLEAQGQPIGPYDILIAATACAVNGTLVTHNIKEFKRIGGLQIEDWF